MTNLYLIITGKLDRIGPKPIKLEIRFRRVTDAVSVPENAKPMYIGLVSKFVQNQTGYTPE